MIRSYVLRASLAVTLGQTVKYRVVPTLGDQQTVGRRHEDRLQLEPSALE
jgi:hypothetical protein